LIEVIQYLHPRIGGTDTKGMKITLEIYRGNAGSSEKYGNDTSFPDFAKNGICSWMYKGDGTHSYQVGKQFKLPDEAGKICPWLLFSAQPFVQVLACNGTLPWKNEGTIYQKVIDQDGITTEYVRCPDPTDSGIVVKITRDKSN
jgi:hypothetical protein